MKKHQSRGFTLVELLVVVGIIALLVAILVPSVQKANAIAKQTVCASNLKQIFYASSMYCEDNNGHFPTIYNTQWYKVLSPYMQLQGWIEGGAREDSGLGQVHFTCPEPSDPEDVALDDRWPQGLYGISFGTITMIGDSATLAEVPPTAYVFGDAAAWYIHSPAAWAFDKDLDGDGTVDTNTALYNLGSYPPMHIYNLFRPFRHPNGGNVAFADSHVEPVTRDQWQDNYQGVWGEYQ